MRQATPRVSLATFRPIVFVALTAGAFLLIAFALAESHGPTAQPAQAAATPPTAWGDLNCSGTITTTDIQLILNTLVGVTPLPVPNCPTVGSTVTVSGNPHIWGDVRCDTAIDASDGLALDAYILSQPLLTETPPCPDIGAVVTVTDVGGVEPQDVQSQGVPATGTITITVQAPPNAIGSLDVSLVYDDNLMTATGCDNGFTQEACSETFASDKARWAGENVGGLKGTVTVGTIDFTNYSQAGRDSITTIINKATDTHGVDINLTVTVTGTTPPSPTPVGSPTPTPAPEQRLDAGYFHNCMAQLNQTVVCWGSNANGESSPPAGTFTSVSAGYWLSCGVRTNKSVSCWGKNDSGQLNPQTGSFLEVSAGADLVCGLHVNATVTCWGAGIPGPPSGTFTHISVGFSHACGVRTDQTLACWGVDIAGDLNAPTGTFLDVSAGYDNSCAVRTGGNAVCWGGNSQGKNQVIQLGDFAHTSAGFDHTCSLRTNSLVSCWGSNLYFQSIAPSSSLTVSAGGMHNCAILSTAQVQCWGSNGYGQATVPTGLLLPVHHGDTHLQLAMPISALQVDPGTPAALQAGDTITIDPGNGHAETAIVTAAPLATPAAAGTLGSGDFVYLEAPLQFDHDAGALVVRIDVTPSPTIGDLDCSNDVGVPDGLRLLRFLAGASLGDIRSCPPPGSLTPEGAGISVGDFDCDGKVDATDALKLFTYAAGLQVQHACAIP